MNPLAQQVYDYISANQHLTITTISEHIMKATGCSYKESMVIIIKHSTNDTKWFEENIKGSRTQALSIAPKALPLRDDDPIPKD